MDTWGMQGRVLALSASLPRPVSNAAACHYPELCHSLRKRAVDSRADQFSVNSAGQFPPTLHAHPP
jgi:hypothetical protein